ncbi:hypothetical protein DITRI_Ditri07aG0105000 [Diplodiscus trichospermus]
MGEVVVSSDEVEEARTESGTEKENGELEGNKRRKTKPGSSASAEVVKWERFLPRMSLRVLLVEADDSTRQIIAALLRKCSYRVMSSQDSISTVYKCMLRGAADYLVKPIRRNELRNLWQHVWRRQASMAGGNSPQDESVGQKKVEATSENNAASNHSSGCLAGAQRNKEQTEKGSDAQSSCTKPDMEVESTHMENTQEFSHLTKGNSIPSESQKHEAHANFNKKLLMHEVETGVVDAYKDASVTLCKGVELESQRRDTDISVEACDALVYSPREAIDFMGSFNRNCNSSSINSASKFDFSPHLDLSLRRCNPNVFENQVTQERPTLWHPDSSAFTRYTSRLSQPLHSPLTSVSDQNRESMTNSEKMLSSIISDYNSSTASPGSTFQLKQTEVAASCTRQGVLPVPVPVKGIRLNSLSDGYNSVIHPIFYAQSSASPMPSPSPTNQQEPALRVNLFRHSSFETNSSRLASDTNQSNQPFHKLDQNLDEDRGLISPTTDQSASSSFCNGSLSQFNGIAYGSTGASNGNVDQVAIVQASTESKKDDSFPSPCGNSHRSIQREAALTKFRMKRKDRCYEKKVRYESRKKLAEQRPRVKGQFVRQVQADPCHCGNSSDG